MVGTTCLESSLDRSISPSIAAAWLASAACPVAWMPRVADAQLWAAYPVAALSLLPTRTPPTAVFLTTSTCLSVCLSVCLWSRRWCLA